MIGLMLVVVFVVMCCCTDTVSGVEWKRLFHETKTGMKRFEKSDYVFAVDENLEYCRKKLVKLKMNYVTLDWGVVIQRALNEVRTSKKGGTVLLPKGTLWMRTQIEVPSYVCLKGEGMYETIMRVHPESPAYKLAGTIRTAYTERISFFDFTQDGNRNNLAGSGQNRFGIYTHLSNYVWMKNVRIMDNKWFGFDPHGANTAWSYYLVMEDCYSSGNGKDGFTIDQYYFVSMLNSVATNNLRHGINVVSGSRYVLVKGNLIDGNRYCSLVAQNNEFGTGSVLFSNNHCRNYPLAGTCLRGVFDVDVLNNYFSSQVRPGVPAFYLHNTWNVKLVRNSWIKTWRKALTANSRYEEYNTRQVSNDPKEIEKFDLSFARMNAPLSPKVDINNSSYGKTVANNRVPLKNSFKSLKKREQLFRRLFDVDVLKEHRVYKRNNLLSADPKCVNGLRMDTICCPSVCGECSEEKCHAKYDYCCPERIRQDASSCDTVSAPCIMSRKHTTGPDPVCAHGVSRGRFCCNKSCKTCGGPKCSRRGPNKVCCLSGVKRTGRKCRSTNAPCVMPKKKKERLRNLSRLYEKHPDPKCRLGLASGTYCCLKICGKCDDGECKKRLSDKLCCSSGVKRTSRKCDEMGAPCVMSQKKEGKKNSNCEKKKTWRGKKKSESGKRKGKKRIKSKSKKKKCKKGRKRVKDSEKKSNKSKTQKKKKSKKVTGNEILG